MKDLVKASITQTQATQTKVLPLLGILTTQSILYYFLQTQAQLFFTPIPDRYIWTHNPLGSFNVKSCYLANKTSPDLPFQQTTNKVWKSNIHHRHKIFLWRIIRNSINTRSLLKSRNIIYNDDCPLCNGEEETGIHLFLHCPVAKALWFSKWGIRTDRLTIVNMPDLIEVVLDARSIGCSDDKSREFKSWGIAFLTTLWKTRNSKSFNPEFKVTIEEILHKIEEVCVEISELDIVKTKKKVRTVHDPRLEDGSIRINHDASYSNKRGASACIATDHKGITLLMYTKLFPSISAVEAESVGLWESMVLAENNGWRKVVFEGDCQVLFRAITTESHATPWHCANWVNSIKTKAGEYANWSFKWIPRDHNSRADKATKWAISNTFEGILTDNFPV